MTDPIRPKVVSIFNQVLNCSIAPDENPSRNEVAQWDSLKHIELILTLEEKFRVRFSIEQFQAIESLNDIVRVIEEQHES